MESRWHPHGQPSAAPPAHVVLPSVAQLIASSSTPSTGSVPAYHQPNSSLPPILGSTPHSPPPIAPSANAPSPTEPLHQRHTSRASPTGSASSMSERSYHHQPSGQYQPPQGVTFHGSHPEADLHRPANAPRQDSAISHLIPGRLDTAKEASSLVRPSEPELSSARRSPNSSHHPTAPTNSGHVLLHSSAPAPPAIAHEHVTTSSNYSHTHPPPEHSHRTHSPPHTESSHSSTTRQPRFNVRFATNHTPENMPSVQRPRHASPPSVTVPPPERVEEAAPPKSEPSRSAVDRKVLSILLGHQTDQAEPSSETHEGPERCAGCNEAWRPMLLGRPSLPKGTELDDQGGPEQQHEKMARILEANQENLRQYNRQNDEAFEQWKKTHSRCLVGPAKPPQNGNISGPSNKRKPEAPLGDVSKRRAMPNGHAITAPPVHSSTSA